MTRAVLTALTTCLFAAFFEAICAGKGVRQRMATVHAPSYSIPFGAWIAIGGIYYAICFMVLTRLLLSETSRPVLALTLLACIMILNALWNVFFFRTRDLRQAFFLGIAYSAIALALLVVLFKRDLVAAICFGPYAVYLLYANVWGYRVWQLNRQAPDE